MTKRFSAWAVGLALSLLSVAPVLSQLSPAPSSGGSTVASHQMTTSLTTVSATETAGDYVNTQATLATLQLPTSASGKRFCIYNGQDTNGALVSPELTLQLASGQTIRDAVSVKQANGTPMMMSAGGTKDEACVFGLSSTDWQLVKRTGTWNAVTTPTLQNQTATNTCKWTTGTTFTCTIAAAASGHSLWFLAGGDPFVGVDHLTATNVTWTTAPVLGNQTFRETEAWCGAVSGGSSGTTVTVTLNGTPSDFGGNISEWDTIPCPKTDLNTMVDASAATLGSATTFTTGSVALNHSVGIVFAILSNATKALSSGPTNSFVALNTPQSSNEQFAYRQFDTNTPGTSFSTAWTLAAGAVQGETLILSVP